jgi:hypothetical protein
VAGPVNVTVSTPSRTKNSRQSWGAKSVSVSAAARAWRSQPPLLELNLAACGITSVLWATGFDLDFGWIDAPVLDAAGAPIQRRGLTSSPGLYFLGLRRMYKIKSSFIGGVGEDAAYVVEQIAARTSA